MSLVKCSIFAGPGSAGFEGNRCARGSSRLRVPISIELQGPRRDQVCAEIASSFFRPAILKGQALGAKYQVRCTVSNWRVATPQAPSVWCRVRFPQNSCP